MRLKSFCFMFAIVFCLQSNVCVSSQTTDSLLNVLWQIEDDNEKIKILNQLSLLFADNDYDKAIDYCKQALSLANREQNDEASAISNMIMAELFEKGENYQPSINYYLISIKYFQRTGNDLKIAEIYNKLAIIYILNQYDYNQGLLYSNNAFEYATECGSEKEIALAYNSMARVFFYQEEYSLAYDYFSKSLEIRERIGNDIDIAASYNNIGEIFRINGEYEKAIQQYNKAIVLNEKSNCIQNLAINNFNLGLVYSVLNESVKAEEFFKKSIELNQGSFNVYRLIQAHLELGRHYNKCQEYDKAIQTFKIAEENALKTANLQFLSEAVEGLTYAYEGLGNIKKAYESFKIYSDYKDSLFTKTKAEQLDEVRTRFSIDLKEKELTLKDNEIALLQREQRITYFRQLVLILVIIILVIFTTLIVTRLRNRNKKHKLILEQREAISKARQEVMEAELKNKSNELTNYALHIGEKNKFLIELKEELKRLKSAPSDAKEVKIKELALTIQQNIQIQEDLEEFQKNVNTINKEFYTKLKAKFPNLTKNEERLCALIRLNLSSKEIAALSNISVRAVEMGRYRLRKKLNLSSEENIVVFLQQI